ncbi:MAG: DUF2974 domain-containing protein [Alphaproteobacteria bacterium]|nr:DUF2974 domain-containing protein [Alphaproteobacteria bacterium]
MNANLFKAILAMDSYNRGYGEGIKLPVVLNTTKLGNATIASQSDTTATGQPVLAGFYGISYQLAGGEKVISYRGTDAGEDAAAYPIAVGSTGTAQGRMAFEFYNAVATAQNGYISIDPRLANISLTGHSLGGGLAGLVGENDNFNITKSQVM